MSEPHKVAINLEWKSKMGAHWYLESVIQDTPIAKTVEKICANDKNVCQILSNSACIKEAFEKVRVLDLPKQSLF